VEITLNLFKSCIGSVSSGHIGRREGDPLGLRDDLKGRVLGFNGRTLVGRKSKRPTSSDKVAAGVPLLGVATGVAGTEVKSFKASSSALRALINSMGLVGLEDMVEKGEEEGERERVVTN
jgi:hypothetical protein